MGSPVERERRRRIKLAVWAYAYEIKSNPLVPDGVFDEEALKVDLSVDTGRPDLDAWFRANFQPHTGSWVWRHPEPGKLNRLYRQAKESL
ncbi:hypothetical protein [Croceicoccus naphthovorans]|uniref:Uncharacterized protein n=1 Tax=Croceicoccus naphthovorans TaxID=1348774 RepID=A0A0G3XFI6_9SPHN|nr:hypothetical protein [Croceicoccus naphthovorans]AKM09379.1 hypothetical protein AB433_04280 [Croceicoccus naphthovorans]